ncbi:MAG: hypothetical protein ACKVZH_16940 [Blastocatellia bacterium]
MTENSVTPLPQENNQSVPEKPQSIFAQPIPAAEQTPLAGYEQAETAELTQQLNSATSWFYVLAGLSIINSLIAVFGGTFHFIFGLGITGVVDAIVLALQAESLGIIIGLMFSIAIAGLFVIFGFLARKRMHWVYLVGIGVYLLDGLLLLFFGDYLGAAFHAYVLFRLYQGLSASRQLSSMAVSQ